MSPEEARAANRHQRWTSISGEGTISGFQTIDPDDDGLDPAWFERPVSERFAMTFELSVMAFALRDSITGQVIPEKLDRTKFGIAEVTHD
jgi:hypothetical protein